MKEIQKVRGCIFLFVAAAMIFATSSSYGFLQPGESTVESKPMSYYISTQTPAFNAGDLLDGVTPTTWDSSDWTKFHAPYYGVPDPNDVNYAMVTFDLGQVTTVNNFRISYHGGVDSYGGYGIYGPVSYDVSYSASSDEASFTTPVNFAALQQPGIVNEVLDLGGVSTRYIRIKFNMYYVASPVEFSALYLGEVSYNYSSVAPYTYDPATPPSSYDPGDLLYNGIDNIDNEYVYFYDDNTELIINFDLQEVATLDNVQISYLELYNIHKPEKIQVFHSDTTPVIPDTDPNLVFDILPGDSNGGQYRPILDLGGIQARYVRIKLTRFENNSGNWFRLGEIGFNVGPVPGYTIDDATPAWPFDGDDSGADLYNGVVADGRDSKDWVEWAPNAFDPNTPAYAIIHFDLLQDITFNNVVISYMNTPSVGVTAPEDFEISYSNDGVTYTTPVTVSGFDHVTDTECGAISTLFELSGTTARYVTIKVNCKDYNDANWMFLSEIEFNGKLYLPITADFNYDNMVDVVDLASIAASWNTSNLVNIAGNDYCQLPPVGDMNNDCQVTIDDLLLLVPEWLYDNN